MTKNEMAVISIAQGRINSVIKGLKYDAEDYDLHILDTYIDSLEEVKNNLIKLLMKK